MKIKLLTRLLCALLSVLTLVCVLPAMSVSAADGDLPITAADIEAHVATRYDSAQSRLSTMTLVFDNGEYSLYVDELVGDVAYRKNSTGEILLTNPWDSVLEESNEEYEEVLSQITLEYKNNAGKTFELNSYEDAALKGQISVKAIKNGVRIEYAIGNRSARTLLPQMIERSAFEQKILKPMLENATLAEYQRFKGFYTEIFYASLMEEGRTDYAEGIASSELYTVAKTKYIDMYALDQATGVNKRADLEAMIKEYCPEYTFEEMDNDHAYVEYEEESVSPPVFKMALEYTIDANGLVVNLPANGLRYDESAYRILDFTVLPYMGACNSNSEGYSFLPDGSGTLFELNKPISLYNYRVYGFDYAISDITALHNQVIRMPVFGQVETEVFVNEADKTETAVKRGYLGIIEAGESLASIEAVHDPAQDKFSRINLSFITRQSDMTIGSATSWDVYASRRYTDDYRVRYIMLSDDSKAQNANLSSYYECSWMGMACAYRDYLDATQEGYDRLTAENTKSSIPLYIETFGAVDSVQKVLSMPVTVSVPLTTFENVGTMYDYLAGNGVTNVNFKLTGYANGGMYSDVPYKLKWEKSVGGSQGFEDLTAYAAEKGFGLYPDFDFVYTSQADGGNKVNMKKNASRTIENRYTARRVYSATKMGLVSYYQMVLSPETYSKFYEKLGEKYAKYENATGISLASFGNSLNSDYDEEKTVLREEAKEYVAQALAYFKKDYKVMIDGGNAYTWRFADHILNVPLDSSLYNYEMSNVPFMGVVLHGYVEFAGSPMNMEGDLSYAMLKAIENGAYAYFILSYANTELLKEDILLSQNYSVRYDIWQNRLVDIYAELNSLLADVQTKLIIGHTFLDGTRVADQNELLEDIANIAEERANAIEEQIRTEHADKVSRIRQAKMTAVNAAGQIAAMENYTSVLNLERKAPVSATKYLLAYWEPVLQQATYEMNGETFFDLSMVSEGAIMDFGDWYRDIVVARYVGMRQFVLSAAQTVLNARVAYNYLVAQDAVASVQNEAGAGYVKAVEQFLILMGNYDGRTAMLDEAVIDALTANVTDTTALAEDAVEVLIGSVEYVGTYVEALPYDVNADDQTKADQKAALEEYILGETAPDYGMGMEALFESFMNLLIAQGLYDPTAETTYVDVDAMIEAEEAKYVVTNTGSDVTEPGDDETEPAVNSKYSIDANVVLVTYGENGQKFGEAGTKSFILNFNDYVVKTTVTDANGVTMTYTVEAYGYVVITY